MRVIYTLPVIAVVALTSAPALAQGTSAQAKEVLQSVVDGMKAGEAATIEKINKGGYTKGDLYPFCGGPDGKYSAHGANTAVIGQSLKDLKDKTGKAIGEEFYKDAQTGKMTEVPYMWPKPGGTEPVQKVTYVEKVGNQICGVGYYK